MTNKSSLALAAWFYLGWFGCVFFAKWGLSGWSLIFPVVPMALSFRKSSLELNQYLFLALMVGCGIMFDSMAYLAGLLKFSNHHSMLIPTWLISMWLLFACTFFLLHGFLRERVLLAAILGAVFGPLSYLSGESFQVLTFTHSSTVFIYAFFWALYFPLSHVLYRKLI